MFLCDAVKALLKPLDYFDHNKNARFCFPNEEDGGLACLFDCDVQGMAINATEAVHSASVRLQAALRGLLEARIDVGRALYTINRALIARAGLRDDELSQLRVERERNWADGKYPCLGLETTTESWANFAVNYYHKLSLVCLCPGDPGCFLKVQTCWPGRSSRSSCRSAHASLCIVFLCRLSLRHVRCA